MKIRRILRILVSVVIIASSLKLALVFQEKTDATKTAFRQEVEQFHQNEERVHAYNQEIEKKQKLSKQVEDAEAEYEDVEKQKQEVEAQIEEKKSKLTRLEPFRQEFIPYEEDFEAIDQYNMTYFNGAYNQKSIDGVTKMNKAVNVGMEIGKYVPGWGIVTDLLGNCMQDNNKRYYDYMEKLNEHMSEKMQPPMIELSQAIQRMHARLEFYKSFVDEDNSLEEQYRNAVLLEQASDRIWKLDEIYEDRETIAKSARVVEALADEVTEIYKFVLDESENYDYFYSLYQIIDDNQNLASRMEEETQPAVLSKSEKLDLFKDSIDIYCETIDEACDPGLSSAITDMDLGFADVPNHGYAGFRLYPYRRKSTDSLIYLSARFYCGKAQKFEIYYYMNGQPARAWLEKVGTLYFDINGEELTESVDDETRSEIYDLLFWCSGVPNLKEYYTAYEFQRRISAYIWP